MEHSFALVRAAFLQRLEQDNFYDLRIHDRPSSVLEFIDFLTAGNLAMRQLGLVDRAQFPDLTNLEITFSEFLARPIKLNDRDILLRTLFCEYFCEAIAVALVREVSRSPHAPGDDAALGEIGVATWPEWVEAMIRPDRVHQLANDLTEAASQALEHRTLISFFIRAPVPGKFSMWGPGASSGQGRKLPTRVIESDGYSVAVSVSRYEEVECAAAAYEWQGVLTLTGESEPTAAACGMVYVFDRADGALIGGLSDLIMASDSMTDEDVMQAKAFITQHDDAADVIEQSDLCFVWLWERKGGAEKGTGAKCLAAALDDLRRRFKKVRTVVFNAHPGQFVPRRGIEPPMVTVERQSAVESLVNYIHSLGLKFDVRAIFSKQDNEQHDALVALGEAMNGQYRGDDDDDDDAGGAEGELDLDTWENEISYLLRLAGLDELADDFDDGEAADDKIITAVKHIVFDSGVHYLRPGSSSGFSPALIGMLEEVPHEEAHDEIRGMDEFCAELPDNMRVIAVYWLDDYAVCTVEADTPFGELTEYFTLVRKPRPINVDSFFRGIS